MPDWLIIVGLAGFLFVALCLALSAALLAGAPWAEESDDEGFVEESKTK